MFLKRNLHSVDKIIRLLIGVICIYLGFIDHTAISNDIVSNLLGLFGLINLLAGISSYCPVYGLAGISTYHKENIYDKSES